MCKFPSNHLFLPISAATLSVTVAWNLRKGRRLSAGTDLPEGARQLRRAHAGLAQVRGELGQDLGRIPDKACGPDLDYGSTGEHELRHVGPAGNASAPEDRHVNGPGDVIHGLERDGLDGGPGE